MLGNTKHHSKTSHALIHAHTGTESEILPAPVDSAGVLITGVTQAAAVEAWDMSQVKNYLVNRHGMDPATFDRLEVEYKRFVILNLENQGVLIPIARPVDVIWHTHILFTNDYLAFCDRVNNGNYFHHRPSIDEAERSRLAPHYQEQTLRLYKQRFGEPDESIWGLAAQECGCCED